MVRAVVEAVYLPALPALMIGPDVKEALQNG